MHKLHLQKLVQRSLIVVTTLFVIACQTTTVTVLKPKISQQVTAESIFIALNYEQGFEWGKAASMYQHLADNSAQPDRSKYLQKTALMLFKDQHYDEMQTLYDSLTDGDILEKEAINKYVLLAGLYFENGKTYQSLGNLPDIETITDPTYKALALNIRSKGVLAIGKPMETAKLRIQIGQYLESDFEIQENHKFIWDALNRITELHIIKALSQQQTIDLRGWLELNLIARRSNMLPAKIEPWIEKWHEIYVDHEASLIFADQLVEESKLIYINPTRIALMLPLSDKLKNVAEAIQNGFLYAYYNDGEEKPELEIINASSEPQQFSLQYNQAIQNGADFIVGPLDKKLVNELQLNEELKIPTLTLNYADNDRYGINNLYQFGLRPEDEAEQIADYALISSQYHAVTLTPDSKLGDRLNKAFTERFEALGGQVVESARYPSRKNDYSPSIKQLLNLNSSKRRHSILQQVIGEKSEFIPRRRQDIDMVFIAGNPRQARLIKPQLKFHHAKGLNVYATSSISSSISDPDADRDLDDILFVDTPWALTNTTNPDFAAIKKLWPKQSKRYARFFALGIDAYKLIPSLRRLLITPEEKIALNSGTISVDTKGRVHRELILATYKKGRAQVLKESVEVVE
ncbi:MAG: penicillin-binding protein activator [Gammaproteobacteria bacterium]|jgi:hypothetical protein|nr:penicillin-binding protein activator [Gammaproteobacteria bacterium]